MGYRFKNRKAWSRPKIFQRSNRRCNDFQKGFDSVARTIDRQEEYLFRGKMNFLIPKGGFVHNNVQRLLLKSGSLHHLNNVSMAIFLEAVNW